MMTRKIVLVDDEKNVLSGLYRTLDRQDYNIKMFTNAERALEYIDEEPGDIDIIISDNKMPEIEGTDFLIRIKEKYPNIIRIMLTGNSSLEDAKKAIEDGKVYKFLTKPTDSDELKCIIRLALAHKDLWSQNRKLIEQLEKKDAELSNMKGKDTLNPDNQSFIIDTNKDENLDDFLRKYFDSNNNAS